MSARALDEVRAHGGPELVERLEHLEASRGPRPALSAPARGPDRGARLDADVILAGGGLSLLIAPLLAARGVSVLVVERARAGTGHREWNASAAELTPLWESGLLSRAEVEALVVARYERGLCRWHGGGTYPVRGVLDHAVDAAGLLSAVRAVAEARGVRFLDRHAVEGDTDGPGGVSVDVRPRDGGRVRTLSARLLVDARGAASPYADADLVCPTVGGVLADLDVDRTTGDILATIDDAQEGRQHVWEGFPGRPRETTVYLFYYAFSRTVAPGSLLSLYARFFAERPRYARGEGRLVRPTFGYIPGWSRLTPPARPPGPRVVLFGDAAARHSALTYCGFGSMLRAFVPFAGAVERALDTGAPMEPLHDLPIHAGTGALSALMSREQVDPRAANALLDAAFGTLFEMGEEAYARLLQDRMSGRELARFLHLTARRRPDVYRSVFGALGAGAVARWGAGLAAGWLRDR